MTDEDDFVINLPSETQFDNMLISVNNGINKSIIS